eukprot:CAMPEP_0176055104 /NCGR_PEP_ID=MMETSP0120_2-20121206/27427_1 /TAXON_ID=160619 /ORGANISM="Kryptoperidinium foliaceum, Strain CCMP 1326" /LENGTH=349 /DNA_ID=CAMNT_0017388587 /DNA_START=152 /DNA_END=1201 /DNA_ORIENTATION=+
MMMWMTIVALTIIIWSSLQLGPEFSLQSSSHQSRAAGSVISKTVPVYKHHVEDGAEWSSSSLLGLIRYHFDPSMKSNTCSHLLLLGVGTTMKVADYERISKAIVRGKSTVVVFTDHNVDSFKKTSPQKYASLFNETIQQLENLIPYCESRNPAILFGGHSASGQAALQAWQMGLLGDPDSHTMPAGFIGLDPYLISSKTLNKSIELTLPSLNWGFSNTTCLVDVEKAARAAYGLTRHEARVLYALRNEEGTADAAMTHCVFADHGCGIPPFTCGAQMNFDWVLDAVATGIHLFLTAIDRRNPFHRNQFNLPKDIKDRTRVYVNDDNPNPMENSEENVPVGNLGVGMRYR